MNKYFSIGIILIVLASCNNHKKSDEVASYTYEEEVVELNEALQAKFPDWIKEGMICYGLVVQINQDGQEVKGKPVKAKIVKIGRNAVKMKALESVSLVETIECTKMGLAKGQTWDEKHGDLFLSLNEAVNRLKEKNIYMASGRFTVD